MAVKPDSKGNVKGTKNSEKITFGTSNEWQKALTVNAGAGNDTIDFKKSKYKNNKLNGEAGNDTIYGGTNIDIIKGGLGTDLIYGYNGKDELYGDAGKDTIYGGNGDDYLNGGADNDKLYGDAGTDTLMGGDGNDSLYGGDGIDSVVGGNGDDYIEGGAGFGRLFGLTGNDTIKGGKDKDTIDGGDDKDVLYGGGDSDTIKGNKGNDVLYGEEGNDYLYGMNDNDTLYGGAGNDLLDGGPGNDSLIGGDGNDTVRAGADDDYVDSGNGDDFIQGHGGKDTIKGGDGNDTIEGNDGDDLIYGDSGNDLLRGGNGNDTITGGIGSDTINAGAGNNLILHDIGDGVDTIVSGGGTDTIDIGTGNIWQAFIREGNDLKIRYNKSGEPSTTESFIVKDYFTNYDHSVKYLKDKNYRNDPQTLAQQAFDYYSEGTITGSKYKEYIYGSTGVDEITAGQTPNADDNREYDYIDANDGNDIINIQNGGKVWLSIENDDGNDVVNNTANANKVYIYQDSSASIYSYQDGDDYKIVREYTVNGEAQTAVTTLTDFKLSEHPDIVEMYYNDSYTNLTAFDLGEDFDPETSTIVKVPSDTKTLTDTTNDNLYILGNTGGDTISTGSGNDVINAGNGNNSITSTDGNNKITAGNGNDTITVNGSGDNYIEVADSNSYTGNEITVNSTGENTIKGGSHIDQIEINGGTNYIYSNGGRDTITLNDGENYVEFTGNSYQASVTVNKGDVTVQGGSQSSLEYGRIYIDGSDNTVNVTGSDNREYVNIYSGSNNNLDLGGGDDSVYISAQSSNVIITGTGEDYITIEDDAGTSALVTIYGGSDSVTGEDTNHNYIIMGSGTAEIHTGSYGDRISLYGENATAVIYGNDNHTDGQGDSITATGSGGVTVYGGINGMNTITGSYHDDSIVGGDNMDTITSNGGDDIIDAGAGEDNIYSGNDTIESNIQISGGAGNDNIYLNDVHKETLIFNNGDGRDTIYNSNTDEEEVKKDVLQFNTTLDDIVLRPDPNNSYSLMIKYNNGQDKVVLNTVTTPNGANVNTSISKIITTDFPEGITFEQFLNTRSIYDLSNTNEFEPDEETNGVYFAGSKYNDSITGTDYNDTIWSGWYESEGGGNDIIYGGAGNDSIQMIYGNNTIVGGAGNDTINMGHTTEDEGINTAIFGNGDGMDYLQDFGARSLLEFDTTGFDKINISNFYEVYDDYGNARVRILINYNNNPTDGVILDTNSLTDENKLMRIKTTAGDTTKTLGELIEEKHIYPADTYYSHIIARPDEYAGTPTAITTEYNDHIYISGWMSTIEGGKGNDTIEAIGRLNENGLLANVGYNRYVVNVDEYGDGDGTDTILHDNSWGMNKILVTGIGENAEDVTAQKAFLNNMNCYFTGDEAHGYALNIEYADDGKLIFKNINKNDLTGLSTGEIGFIYKNDEGKYDYDSNYDDSTRKYYNLAEYLNIPVQMTAGTPYTASENYTEVITGTSADDTLTLNGSKKTIDLKAGNDTIIVRSENYGEYTVKLGNDSNPDYIWFKDVTDPSSLSADRDYLYDENGHTIYNEEIRDYLHSNDLVLWDGNAKIIIKDYFTYARVNQEPTFMTIKYGETGEDTISIKDIIGAVTVDNRLDKESNVYGSCFDDYIKPAGETEEAIYAGKGNDTIEYYAWNSSTDSYKDSGDDIIFGGDGDDSITYRDYYNPNVEIYGDNGDDTINITSGTAYGGAGSDYIDSYGCNDHSHVVEDSYHSHELALYGYSATYEDSNDDGTGNDTIYGGDKNDTIFGSKGNDTILASSGSDLIKAGSGNDYVEAGSDNDTIYGGNGNDVIYTNYSADYYENYEDYTSYRGSGREYIYGEDGNDTIILQGDCSTVSGGTGNDLIVSSSDSQNEFHFNSGDGNDTIYTSRRNDVPQGDTFVFDDIIFNGTNVTANFTEEDNILTVTYSGGTIKVKDYLYQSHHYDEYDNPIDTYYSYTSINNVKSSLDKLIDMNGNTLSIRDMIQKDRGTTSEYDGYIFSESATLADELNSYYAGYGNDTITGNNNNNSLYGYDSSYSGWGTQGDGNDYLDGKKGYNRLYGGWGDDTLIGGYDSNKDTLYGGLGANTYQMKSFTTNSIVAELHISSDKDTIVLPTDIGMASYDKSNDDLLIDYRRTQSYYSKINVYDWYSNPRDIKFIDNEDTTTYLYDRLKMQVEFGDESLGVEFGTNNTTSDKIYLGTSGDDSMTVSYSTLANGGYGNDSIIASYAPSTIYGGEGNDTIKASGGNDTIYGGDGRDSIVAGAGDDIIYTANNTDYYYSMNMETEKSYKNKMERLIAPSYDTEDWDTVEGGAGNDTIFAVGENALLLGDAGNDTYHVTLDNVVSIYDIQDSNNVVLHSLSEQWGESAYIGIDSTNWQALNENGVLIMNYDAYNYWIEHNGDLSEYKGGYVSLSSFGTNHTYQHTTITDSSGNTMSSDAIGELKSQISSWLTAHGMEDIRQEGALYQGSELAEIIYEFNSNNWEYGN